MPHIHTKPGQIDVTVTLYLFRQSDLGVETMLHMHKKLGRLLPVGGHIEIDETPWQAAAHELTEESGYEMTQIKVLQPTVRIKQLSDAVLHPQPIALNTHDVPGNHFHSDLSYALLVEGAPTSPLAAGESEDIRWLNQADLNQLGDDMIFSNTKTVANYVMDNFATWEQVPASEFSLEKEV